MRDPLAAQFATLAEAAQGQAAQGQPDAMLDAFLSLNAVFKDDLGRHPGFRREVGERLHQLYRDGAAAAVAAQADA